MGAWTGSFWLRIGTGWGGGCCKCGNESSDSIKMWGISGLAEKRLASQEGLCSMQ